MGIYLKGMVMPTRCGRCDMCITEADGDIDAHKACCITGAIIDNLGEKMEDCPLVPVPPHGRLIDADAFIRNIRLTIRYDPFAVAGVISFVKDAPTIIPAEEGE